MALVIGDTPSTRTVLGALTKARLLEVARAFDVAVPPSHTKDAIADTLSSSTSVRFRPLVDRLLRDELRAACRSHGIDDATRSRPLLIERLLEAHGAADSMRPAPIFGGAERARLVPRAGDIVRCRHRQWLVEDAIPSHDADKATLVRLVCLDDDNQGRSLEVLWELELGAKVTSLEAHPLGNRIDPPRWFAAYLHALKWNSVTATDPKLFQAPFRAGIKLMAHQLTPLRKALLLPRANLFIADDVGLGKTIEAGLVLQELLLRQRVEFALIVCPPSVALQWRDEMAVRFGLQFEIYNRSFVGRRRRERGFAVNPWSTHTRFIVSYHTLRRPEHRDPLLQHLGERARKSLLILDEAHTAAPASAQKYAIDSRVTRVIRDLTTKFENRLFLSATPHNGHSNSFSALLEMLDPNRFTRGVEVNKGAREAVMVRRLKDDLRRAGRESFPRRDVIRVDLTHGNEGWSAQYNVRDPKRGLISGGAPIHVSPPAPAGGAGGGATTRPIELELSTLLAEYTTLMKPERGRGRLVFVNLQKRLLSSIAAFHRTLELHSESVETGRAKVELDVAQEPLPDLEDRDDDEYGVEDDEEELAEVIASSRALTPAGRARELLTEMRRLARIHQALPDAKALALIDWIRRNQCREVAIGGAQKKGKWTDTRVLVFTEYADTKRWLERLLSAAVDGTDRGDERILSFHGGMSDDQRAGVQEAFNGEPAEFPVRILLATDAAREGVNLQGHCADLFHFDIPWNPARLEQRNGRIDRTLQRADVVRCHYFVYPARVEDVVLDTVVDKIDVIKRELGSLGSVVMERFDKVLERGIDERTKVDLERAAAVDETAKAAVTDELESERDLDKLKREIDEAGRILDSSAKVLEFDPPLLRDAIDVGFELAGISGRLEQASAGQDTWTLPDMPDSWQPTLDSIRPPRPTGELLWDWRRKPLPAVTFTAPEHISERRVHLHLSHPLVQRVMSRFLAQGFGTHDLSRVTVVRTRREHTARVLAFGRLSLFGPGAARLHDQLITIAAPWLESGGEGHLVPGTDAEDKIAIERLETLLAEAPTLEGISEKRRGILAKSAATDFRTLWPHIQAEADARAHDAEAKLKARARDESDKLAKILETQRAGIDKRLGQRRQIEIQFEGDDQDTRQAREQLVRELDYLEKRRATIDKDIEIEPAQIEALYQVKLRRLEPVGLVYIWPETKG